MIKFLINTFSYAGMFFISENKKRFLKNKNIELKINQVWIQPFDIADKYCNPVIISIKNIDKLNNMVTYTTNYLKGDTVKCSITEFKTNYEFQK